MNDQVSTSERQRAFVALGSNLGNSIATVSQTMQRLQVLSVSPLQRSSLWQSTPVDCPTDSPLFINAVVAFEPMPAETPESLLAKLQALEKESGRQPKRALNEPRPLDLDLIAFGQESRRSATLVLPHPRAHQRRFVLAPLAEIAPNLVLPGQTKSVRALLEGLVSNEVLQRLASKPVGF